MINHFNKIKVILICIFLVTSFACGGDDSSQNTPTRQATSNTTNTQNNNTDVQLFEPCPRGDCDETDDDPSIPPEDLWCVTGYRSCPDEE